ncbi:hypothetical protein, variant [Saprolegnia diclina VS20]|nr:hypothetical protein, variant [Saprolegnia diclina VS20]EQC28529.1 hypothetical protein, variant [Saprolegnia diclina VS20]|eukprot:XP_008618177.1 hypothetical protein, variant [Saprolegnia diclina VS20]
MTCHHGDCFELDVSVCVDPIEGAKMTLWSWRNDASGCGLDLAISGQSLICSTWSVATCSSRQIDVEISDRWNLIALELSDGFLTCRVNGNVVDVAEALPWPAASKHSLSVAASLNPAVSAVPLQGRVATMRLISPTRSYVVLDAAYEAYDSTSVTNWAENGQNTRFARRTSVDAPGVALWTFTHVLDVLRSSGGVLWSLTPFFERTIAAPEQPTARESDKEWDRTPMLLFICRAICNDAATADEALVPFQHNPSLGTFGHLWARHWLHSQHLSATLIRAVFEATTTLVVRAATLPAQSDLTPWLQVVLSSRQWCRCSIDLQTLYLAHLDACVGLMAIENIPQMRFWYDTLTRFSASASLREQVLRIVDRVLFRSPTHAESALDALHVHLVQDKQHGNVDVLTWWAQRVLASESASCDIDHKCDLWIEHVGAAHLKSTRVAALRVLAAYARDHHLRRASVSALADRCVVLDDSMPVVAELASLRDPALLLECAIRSTSLRCKRQCIGLLVANPDALIARLSRWHSSPITMVQHVARVGLSVRDRDAEWLAVLDGTARLLGHCIGHALSAQVDATSFLDQALTACARIGIVRSVVALVRDMCPPKHAAAFLAAASTLDNTPAWVLSLLPLWRALMALPVTDWSFLRRITGWVLALEEMAYTADDFVYCGACRYLGLDHECPKCGVPGGDPYRRDLLLVQGSWLEMDVPEAIALKCLLLATLAQHPQAAEKVQCLIYMLPPHLARQIPDVGDLSPSVRQQIDAIVRGPAFEAAIAPLCSVTSKSANVVEDGNEDEAPWTPPTLPNDPVPYNDAGRAVGDTACIRRVLKRVSMSHSLWQTDALVPCYRVDKAEFGLARLRPRLAPCREHVDESPTAQPRHFESLSEALGSSTELWQHSARLRARATAKVTRDPTPSGNSVFVANALVLRARGNISGRFEISSSHFVFAPHESSSRKLAGIDEIKYALGRRYLLQAGVAIEIFWWSPRAPWLVVFESERLCTLCYEASRPLALASLVQRAVHLVPADLTRLSTLLRKPTLPSPRAYLEAMEATSRWQSQCISNLEYLMLVNTAAGRTYNDLNQYFVAPWVSEPTVAGAPRPLHVPIGALNPSRLAQCQARASALASELDDAPPPFLFGSHYSTTGSVLYFLVRLRPFTQYAKDLQGGKLDHADRLFHSVTEAWTNCLTSSDVKELVPELFYHPGVYTSPSPLGMRQNGTVVGDVVLPNDSTPMAFLAKLRHDLEAADIAPWIDLIFGYQNSGAAAWAANNVFFHLTYAEHAPPVPLDFGPFAAQDQDPATTQMQYFGQTPPQVFSSPHPTRGFVCQIAASSAMALTRVMTPSPIAWVLNAKGCVVSDDGTVSQRLDDTDVLVMSSHLSLPCAPTIVLDVGPAHCPGRYFVLLDITHGLAVYGVDIDSGRVVVAPSNAAFLRTGQPMACAATSSGACIWIDCHGVLQVWTKSVLLELLFPTVTVSPSEAPTSSTTKWSALWSSLWTPHTHLPPRVPPIVRPYRTLGVGDVSATNVAVNLDVDLAVVTTVSGLVQLFALHATKWLRSFDVAANVGRALHLTSASILAPESYIVVVSETREGVDVIAVDVNGVLLSVFSLPSATVRFVQAVHVPRKHTCPPLVLLCTESQFYLYSILDSGVVVARQRSRLIIRRVFVEDDTVVLGFDSGDVDLLSLRGLLAQAKTPHE